jgi:RimJ/RimL family protein N-acetyltransferase
MKLVKCTPEYWEFVRILRTHPENKNWFFDQSDISSEDQIKYMTKNSYKYFICLDKNIPVGYIGIINDNEITYCVNPEHKGKGIGTFMVSEIIKLYPSLNAFVFPQNISSKKVFEKLGFVKRIHYIYEKK